MNFQQVEAQKSPRRADQQLRPSLDGFVLGGFLFFLIINYIMWHHMITREPRQSCDSCQTVCLWWTAEHGTDVPVQPFWNARAFRQPRPHSGGCVCVPDAVQEQLFRSYTYTRQTPRHYDMRHNNCFPSIILFSRSRQVQILRDIETWHHAFITTFRQNTFIYDHIY